MALAAQGLFGRQKESVSVMKRYVPLVALCALSLLAGCGYPGGLLTLSDRFHVQDFSTAPSLVKQDPASESPTKPEYEEGSVKPELPSSEEGSIKPEPPSPDQEAPTKEESPPVDAGEPVIMTATGAPRPAPKPTERSETSHDRLKDALRELKAALKKHPGQPHYGNIFLGNSQGLPSKGPKKGSHR
ncbi:hypothetical protein D3C87_1458450 [compost metagenome]